jgi:hypothetical protein
MKLAIKASIIFAQNKWDDQSMDHDPIIRRIGCR